MMLQLRFWATLVLPAALFAQPPAEEGKLRPYDVRLLSPVSLDFATGTSAFTSLLRNVRLPGGVVSLSDCAVSETLRTVRLPADLDLAAALEVLQNTFDDYRWSMDRRAINFLPHKLPAALQISVSKFEWNTSDAVSLTVGRLAQDETIKARLAQFGLTPGYTRVGGLFAIPKNGQAVSRPPAVAHSIRETTVLGVLNAIAASYGSAVWLYYERRCGGQTAFSFEGR